MASRRIPLPFGIGLTRGRSKVGGMSGFVTRERLQELLHYDPETGTFRWLRSGMGRNADLSAGGLGKNGYVYIAVEGRKYLAHRLAWLWANGCWPKALIDHKNMNRADNRLANLREADQVRNSANADKKKNNTSGFKGVAKVTNCERWTARIKAHKKYHYLGCFRTPEEAHSAYRAAADRLLGEFANAGTPR